VVADDGCARTLKALRRRRGAYSSALAIPALVFVLVFCLLPVAGLLLISIGESGERLVYFQSLFSEWSYGRILVRTLRICAAVVLFSFLLGYPLAYFLAFSAPRWQLLWCLFSLLPLWTSVLVRNFAWIFLLQDDGLVTVALGAILGDWLQPNVLYSEAGVVLAMVSTLLPLMVLSIYLSLSAVPTVLSESAASLGASPWRLFGTIIWPLSLSGVMAGAVLVFSVSLGYFITPAVLGGGRVLVAATFITRQVDDFLNWPVAAAASAVILGVFLTLLVIYTAVRALRQGGSLHED
jgi:ABC-type spermidine/putrescine transport system permease subunit I